MLDDQALSKGGYRFPLLELPDVVLANVLQRCPPGSIAGFPLPLALAQVRVTGSVNPHWLRPLLHLASKCPAVLDRLTPHLRSIELLEAQSTNSLIAIAPYLTRLERLSIDQKVSAATLSALPTSLTKLSMREVGLEGASLEDLSSSLLRLTALEELDLGRFVFDEDWRAGGSLPRLRRLKGSWGMPPKDLGTFAPNLEALESESNPQDLDGLPLSLTKLRFLDYWDPEASLLPLTRLAGLKDLGLTPYMDIPEELPELLEALTALTRLEIGHMMDGLPELLEALKNGSEDLGLCLEEVCLRDESLAVEQLFGHLVEVKHLTDNPTLNSLPWAALTRLTRLVLDVDGRKDASWVQPLSQLPRLRDLKVRLKSQVPEGFGALTQCTWLHLREISYGDPSCLQHLTRLRKCQLSDSTIECLAALPSCLTQLHMSGTHKSPQLPLGAALQLLTALEDLHIKWPEGEDRVCDLSPLKLLTRLALESTPMTMVRFGVLPCLREVRLTDPKGMDSGIGEQLGRLPSLRRLVTCLFREKPCGVGNKPGTWRSQEIGQVLLPANYDPATGTITVEISGELSGNYFPPYQHYGNVQLTDGTNTAVLDTSAPGTTRTDFEAIAGIYKGFISAPAAPSPGAFLPGAVLTVAVHQYCEYWRYIGVTVQVTW